MISLYDYLGRAAGPDLGWSVAKYAKQSNASIASREVSNPKYTGTVNLYERGFLDIYFNLPNHASLIEADKEWYNKRNKK